MVCDAGKELIVVYQIGAPAPWQNGKTERYGAHFKDLLEKARAEMVIDHRRGQVKEANANGDDRRGQVKEANAKG